MDATTKEENTSVVNNDDDSIEPGEVTTSEPEKEDKVVNVLDDILGVEDNGGQEDELQKELQESVKTTTPKAKRQQKSKQTGKRKSTRKSKGSATKSKPEATTAAEKPVVKEEQPSTTPAPEKKTAEPDTKKEIVKTSNENTTTSTKNAKEKPAEMVVKIEDIKKEETPKAEKTATKTSKKRKSTTTKKETKTAQVTEEKKVKEKSENDETVKLQEKVKALEMQIAASQKAASATTTESTEKNSNQAEVSKKDSKKSVTSKSSDKKRKLSDTSGSKEKTKKTSSKAKVKAENKKVEEEVAPVKEEVHSAEETMKVLDDVDGSQSDHGSEFSHDSFSHTFSHSRSRSMSGSFTGSFSDSGSLSSFTGSHITGEFSDIEDINIDKEPKKKRKKEADLDDETAEDIENHKSFIDSLLKGARYFIVKSNNHENVTLSKAKGVWSTPPANERKLNEAYRLSTNVILIFSVKESGRFQGFARLASESRRDTAPVAWVLPPGFDPRILGATFKVDWLNRKELQFSNCANLRNPWNENKEVKICRDGQEVEPSVGEVLCRMFEDDLTIDLSRVARHLKQHKRTTGDGYSHHRKREYHHTSRFLLTRVNKSPPSNVEKYIYNRLLYSSITKCYVHLLLLLPLKNELLYTSNLIRSMFVSSMNFLLSLHDEFADP